MITITPQIEAQILNSQGVFDALKRIGPDLETVIKRHAARHSRSIAAGITHQVGFDDGRIILRVVAKDFKSHWFEFGTSKMAARPYMKPGAIEAGFVLRGARRR